MQRNGCGKTQSVLSKNFLLINPPIKFFPRYIKKKGVRILSLSHRKTGSGKTFVEMKSNKNSPRLYRKLKDTAWASLECIRQGERLCLLTLLLKFSRFYIPRGKSNNAFLSEISPSDDPKLRIYIGW